MAAKYSGEPNSAFSATSGTGSYTWMGRILEFMNHKGFNK